MTTKALLALEDGRTFDCDCFASSKETCGEVVFNTSMTGYQEILTDPSYIGQIVIMTYPLIGNYGVNPDDVESDKIQTAGFVVKEYQNFPSNFRAKISLAEYLENQNIIGIENLDTRALTRHIRKAGAMRAFISTQNLDPASCVEKAKQAPHMTGQNLVDKVSTKIPYFWINGKPSPCGQDVFLAKNSIWKHKGEKHCVVVFDFGVKYNILRCLENAGCEIIVVPATTDATTIKNMKPDGIFFSNGPGDPKPVQYAVQTIQELLGYRPMFGICLGHQLLGLALGGKSFKLKFGHRGSNQPVKNLLTGKIEITSQNHGFAIDANSLDENDIQITHINLNDNTLEGFMHKKYPIFSAQYHPEASPGPHDSKYLFDKFINLMK